MELLHRARRDAAEVVRGIDQRDASANAEKRDLDKRVNDLENEVARLITKSEAETAASKASGADLARRLKEANSVILEEKNSGKKREEEAQARVVAILDELKKALEVKSGFFGGSKDLRAALETIVAQNDHDTND